MPRPILRHGLSVRPARLLGFSGGLGRQGAIGHGFGNGIAAIGPRSPFWLVPIVNSGGLVNVDNHVKKRPYMEQGSRIVEMTNLTMMKLLHDLDLDDMLPDGGRPVALTIERRSINWPETGIRLKLEWERNAVFLTEKPHV